MNRLAGFSLVLFSALGIFLHSCGDDDEIQWDDSLESYFPLAEGNSWEYTKSYFKSTGELTTQTDVYWNTDSCCFYISKLELTPDSVDLGRDYLTRGDDGWIYTAGSYRYLSTEYLDEPADSSFLVASREGGIPFEHYVYGGSEILNTQFGNRKCIRTLSVYFYQNQRIEQYRWFCRGLGEYKYENYKIEKLKSGDDGDSYLTESVLRDYSLTRE